MLAAAVAAKRGARVVLFEKNQKLGKKIYITGKGRCNLTNYCSPEEFLKNVNSNPKFLYSAINKFPPKELCAYFEQLGLELVTERGGRVFPASQKASDVTKALSAELSRQKVDVRLNCEVFSINPESGGYIIKSAAGDLLFDKVIVATGGLSYPSTGSTGDGYKFAKSLELSIVPPRAGLAQLVTVEDVKPLEGLSLKNVALSAVYGGKTVADEFGELMFTSKGLSGPIALSVSSKVNRLPAAELYLDLKPALDFATLDARLLREFSANANKQLKNVLCNLLPPRLISFVLNYAKADGGIYSHDVTKESRKALCNALKALKFNLKKVGGFEEAVITCGGVSVSQLKPTCECKKYKGLYFAGETIDVDAMTGGFNLQIAFSTAYAAAVDAADDL